MLTSNPSFRRGFKDYLKWQSLTKPDALKLCIQVWPVLQTLGTPPMSSQCSTKLHRLAETY